jgi:hypothetical protein
LRANGSGASEIVCDLEKSAFADSGVRGKIRLADRRRVIIG